MTIISSNINVIITHGSKSYGNQFVPATSPLPLSSPHLFRHHCIQQQSQRSTSPPPSSSLSLQVLTPFEWTGKGFDSLRCFGTSRLLHQQIAYMMAIRTKLCGCDLHYFRRQSFAPKARQRIWIKCSSEHSRIRKEREGGAPSHSHLVSWHSERLPPLSHLQERLARLQHHRRKLDTTYVLMRRAQPSAPRKFYLSSHTTLH